MLKLFRLSSCANANRKDALRCFYTIHKYSTENTTQKQSNAKDDTTHFGFETVKESEKVDKGNFYRQKFSKPISQFFTISSTVHKVFEDVANSYDVMNDAMSLGIHRIWKDIFIERLGPTHGTKLLDMAGGTGDIAFRYLKYLENKKKSVTQDECTKLSQVTICDINQHMLDVGKKRAEQLNIGSENCAVNWVCANAEKLPFEDGTFSAYTIAFGIRNCTHIDHVIFIFLFQQIIYVFAS